MMGGATIRERQPDDVGFGRSRPLSPIVGNPDAGNENGEPKLAVPVLITSWRIRRRRPYSAPPRTLGRVGNAGKSSSSAIAKTLGSVSAMVGSGSKPSGCATSTSTS
jgi:hypothetical protein